MEACAQKCSFVYLNSRNTKDFTFRFLDLSEDIICPFSVVSLYIFNDFSYVYNIVTIYYLDFCCI